MAEENVFYEENESFVSSSEVYQFLSEVYNER